MNKLIITLFLILPLFITTPCEAAFYRHDNFSIDLPDGWQKVETVDKSKVKPLIVLTKVKEGIRATITIGHPERTDFKDLSSATEQQRRILAQEFMSDFKGNDNTIVWDNNEEALVANVKALVKASELVFYEINSKVDNNQ